MKLNIASCLTTAFVVSVSKIQKDLSRIFLLTLTPTSNTFLLEPSQHSKGDLQASRVNHGLNSALEIRGISEELKHLLPGLSIELIEPVIDLPWRRSTTEDGTKGDMAQYDNLERRSRS